MEKTKLQIHTWPEKILQQKCRTVKNIDPKIKQIFDDMLVLMRQDKGIGLAANQAGINLRLIVIETKDKIFKLANPRIIKKSGKIIFAEGCLSFPGIELEVCRANKILVSALNEQSNQIEIEAEGLLAVVFQHEIDHINGVSFIDRVSPWQRLKITPILKKLKLCSKKVKSN